MIRSVHDEVEDVIDIQHLNNENTQECLDGLIASLEQYQHDLCAGKDTSITTIEQKVKQAQKSMASSQKNTASAISKLGKTIDKTFDPHIERAVRTNEGTEEWHNNVKVAVAHHLIRQGRLDLASDFSSDQNDELERLRLSFSELADILAAMKKRDLGPAQKWAHGAQAQLSAKGSRLLFDLHRMEFIHRLVEDGPTAALAYARANLASFVGEEAPEMRRLMTALLFADLETSPYADLASEVEWTDLYTSVSKEYHSALGLSYESPLSVAITAGTTALPALLKLATLAKDKFQEADVLQVEVEVDRKHRFHSTFACPVSRECTTRYNPPYMLPCGHVLARESIENLARGGVRFKCPYCPAEAMVSACIELHIT